MMDKNSNIFSYCSGSSLSAHRLKSISDQIHVHEALMLWLVWACGVAFDKMPTSLHYGSKLHVTGTFTKAVFGSQHHENMPI